MDKGTVSNEYLILDLIERVISGKFSIIETRRGNYDDKQEFDFILKKKRSQNASNIPKN